MKNILYENMRRFGTKNLNESVRSISPIPVDIINDVKKLRLFFRNELSNLPKKTYFPPANYSKVEIYPEQQRIMVHTNGSTRGTLSGIYDPSKSNLETRGEELFEKFGYEPISDIKKIGNLYFLVILIITDKRTMEN